MLLPTFAPRDDMPTAPPNRVMRRSPATVPPGALLRDRGLPGQLGRRFGERWLQLRRRLLGARAPGGGRRVGGLRERGEVQLSGLGELIKWV